MGVLENCIREDLNAHAPRRMAVLSPLKVILTTYPEGTVEMLEVSNHPQDDSMGKREIAFTREIYIDSEDFREEAPNKYTRLVAGGEVRLRNAYVIRCNEVIKDVNGEVIELHCSHDPDTLGSNPVGRKVKGVIHWVSAEHAIPVDVHLYDRLFTHPTPTSSDGATYRDFMNPDSLRTLTRCVVESSLLDARPGDRFQFEREGYYCLDPQSSADRLVFNRTVTLRDSWSKVEQQYR
jgi:glutaminyl-tRNA synthetase